MPTIVQNYIEEGIELHNEFLRKVRDDVNNLFREITKGQLSVIKQYLIYCELGRPFRKLRNDQLRWALTDIREIEPSHFDGTNHKIKICGGWLGSGFLHFSVPSPAIASKEGFEAWLGDIEKQTELKRAALKEVEVAEATAFIKKNRKLTREILEATKRAR